jgi:tetratricopeptide (TPR) repeat protein
MLSELIPFFMRRFYFLIVAVSLSCGLATQAQDKPAMTPATTQRPAAQQTGQQPPQQSQPVRQVTIDISEYGAQIKPEPRLIVLMAALDAAGFDPTPQGEEPSAFRAQLRRDMAGLDPDLRQRLKTFYERNKLQRVAGGREPTAADQAARYVSLAYALGPAPGLEEPPRSLDLPEGLLEVLDFAPLVREFYRKSGIEERMPVYLRAYQAEGDRLRRSTAAMIYGVISYLNTRPVRTTIERIAVNPPTGKKPKKDAPVIYKTREHERRFFVVPDLLAAPGAINFRIIADDYFVIVSYCDETKYNCSGRDNNPAAPEVRRAYLQYVIDPLVMRFNRDISARREQLKQLLDARKGAGENISPDVFLMVARSLVTAIDVRLDETMKLNALSGEASAKLAGTTGAAERTEIVKGLEAARAAVADEAIAQLAEGYENGATLAFYFAEQLRGVESSGFDITNSIADMIASFDPSRETRRLEEADAARKRAALARKARAAEANNAPDPGALPNATLVKRLIEVDSLLKLKDYSAAEERLLALLREFPAESRVFFALAETANLSARDATDEDVQSQRLNKALTNYRNAVSHATNDTDRCMLTRAHEESGRILGFMDQKDEAIKEFDAAIRINDSSCGSYRDAVEAKKRLSQP